MAALTWVVPSGLYKTNEDGDRIANSYYLVDKERTVTEEKDGKKEEVKKHDQQGLWDVFTAPIKGIAGTEVPDPIKKLSLLVIAK